ncbi:root hair defective 3-like protein [Tanacetum coccineum]
MLKTNAIRKVLRNETKTVVFEFTDALSGYEMDEDAKKNHISTLENYAIDVVEGKTKKEASKVLHRMKERFTTIFNHDNDLMPRTWTGKEDIRAINKIARTSKETEYAVSQAIFAQKANKQNGNWLPPPWAIAALLESIIPIIYLCRLPAFESIVGSASLRF